MMAKKKLQSAGPAVLGQNFYYDAAGNLIDEYGQKVDAKYAETIKPFLEPWNPDFGKKPEKKKRKPAKKAEEQVSEKAAEELQKSAEKKNKDTILDAILEEYFPLFAKKKKEEDEEEEKKPKAASDTEIDQKLSQTNALIKESNVLIRQSITNQQKILDTLDKILTAVRTLNTGGAGPNVNRPRIGRGRARLLGATSLATGFGELSTDLDPSSTKLLEMYNAAKGDGPKYAVGTGPITSMQSVAPVARPPLAGSLSAPPAEASERTAQQTTEFTGDEIVFDAGSMEFRADKLTIDAKDLDQSTTDVGSATERAPGSNQQTGAAGRTPTGSAGITGSTGIAKPSAGASETMGTTGSMLSPSPLSGGSTESAGKIEPASLGNYNTLKTTVTTGKIQPGMGAGYEASGLTREQVAQMIREEAEAAGVNPDIALAVARSEGLDGYVGDGGTSFGPFQLHYGGGLGDIFTKETGLHARDPSTVREQIKWIFKNIRKYDGWRPYHGAKNTGIGQWDGIDKNFKPEPTGMGRDGAPAAPDQGSQRDQTIAPRMMDGTKPRTQRAPDWLSWDSLTDEQKHIRSQEAEARRGEAVGEFVGQTTGLSDLMKGDPSGALKFGSNFVPGGMGAKMLAGAIAEVGSQLAPKPRQKMPVPEQRVLRQTPAPDPRRFKSPKDPLHDVDSIGEPRNPSARHAETITKSFKKYDMMARLPREVGF